MAAAAAGVETGIVAVAGGAVAAADEGKRANVDVNPFFVCVVGLGMVDGGRDCVEAGSKMLRLKFVLAEEPTTR